jgi:NADH-quinone oxidoreductase subunit F
MMIHPLLPELIELQRKDRYLRPDAILDLSRKLEIPVNRIYSVASFYHAFRFSPCGTYQIKVCVGAACYVKDAESVFSAFSHHLSIPDGDDTTPDGLFTLSKVACLGCCMLAAAVQIDRHIFGHVTPKEIPAVLADFLRMTREDEQEHPGQEHSGKHPSEIRICRCSSCRAAGSGNVYKAFRAEKDAYGFEYLVKEVSCHGLSYRAPLVTVVCDGISYHYDRVQPQHARTILAEHFKPATTLRRATWKGQIFFDAFYNRGHCGQCNSAVTELDKEIDNARLITKNSGITHPESLEEYQAHGGLVAFRKSLSMAPEAISALLKESHLRGRGGGGFLTGEKWRLAYEAPGQSKVVICNADEGDPGAFMDRMLLESYPYRVLEGILIASKFLRVESAIIYIRQEYTQAISVLEKTINSLRESDVFDSFDPCFDIILFKGAGAFVCGEETALLESIECKSGIPPKRPPFPVTNGLGGQATLINNVETFACIPVILQDNGTAFNAVGTPASHGTKAFALAGKVKRGGLIEVPIGISIADIVEKFGGGAEDGHEIKAVMIGGPSGGCIPQKRFDLPVDYETLQQSGAMMGSGGLIVLDERDCMVDLSLYFLRFLREESCGKCVPCREGIIRLCELMEQLTHEGEKDANLLERIESLAIYIQRGSLCALGRTAPNMVLSTLQEFREEFEAHLQGYCPAGKCKKITAFEVSDECIGCTKCAQVCATDAIECIPLEAAWINPELCVKCGACLTVCTLHAIQNVRSKSYSKEHDEKASLNNNKASVNHDPKRTVQGDVIEVDGDQYPFSERMTLLDYASEHGWSIPTLCYLKGKSETAHCMICAAWDESLGRFIPSCEQFVQKGHVYITNDDQVREFRREALSLMLNRHDLTCGKCSGKGNCAFFGLLREYRVKKQKNALTFSEQVVAENVTFDAGKCILCHRCLAVSQNHLTIHNRGEKSCISPAPESWDSIPETVAQELVLICPTGAMTKGKK